MITDLPEQECHELLTTTTVGRVGFVLDGLVHVFPINYAVNDREIFLRTSPDGILRTVAESAAQVAFEVDYHDDLAGSGWSVLMRGPLTLMDDDELPAETRRPSPWAGDDRTMPLRFRIESISGRRARRDPR